MTTPHNQFDTCPGTLAQTLVPTYARTSTRGRPPTRTREMALQHTRNMESDAPEAINMELAGQTVGNRGIRNQATYTAYIEYGTVSR